MIPRSQLLIVGARIATMADAGLGVIEDAALRVEAGKIVWIGASSKVDDRWRAHADQLIEADGALLTPGLIDCHTHLVFAGHRADEFEARLLGQSYAQIAATGGGIKRSVRDTRAASEQALYEASVGRARALLADGVTTIEIKSGYGLELATERRMLRVARRIGAELGVCVRTSFLGAHTTAPEFAADSDAYIDAVIAMLAPLADEGLIDAVDGYGEHLAFSPPQLTRLFTAARALGLPLRLHADQLSDQYGAALAARFDALSADHLEYANDEGLAAMARAGTVAVLLPGAYYALKETQPPPIARMRALGVRMAVASDVNPGTSPLLSLRLALNMACVLFGLSPTEALRGGTVHAAQALGLAARKGQLSVGMDADLVLWRAQTPAELCYWIGGTLAARVFAGGRELQLAA